MMISRLRPSRSFLVALLLAFSMSLTWAAATPLFGVPDEISHMVRAAAAVRGDVQGKLAEDGATRLYRAPAVLVAGSTIQTNAVPCFAFKRDQSPECLIFGRGSGLRSIASSADSYPPVYYLLVGWPSLVFDGIRGLYAMRAMASAIFAGFVALSVSSLQRPDLRSVHLALLVALTPTVWFLGAAVNPSSLAISAAAAAWIGGYRMVRGGEPPVAVVWRFALPLCALLLVRRDSLLWGALIVVATAALANVPRLRMLARSRSTIAWAVASMLCAAYAARVSASSGVGILRSEEVAGSAAVAFGRLPEYFYEMVGVLGWLDTPIPEGAYLLWLAVFFGLVAAAVAVGRGREAFVCVALAVAIAGAIVVIGANRYPYFQGRYALPGAVGVPLLAGLALAAARPSSLAGRRPAMLLAVSVATVHALSYYQQLRRYSGIGSSWWIFDGAVWQSPAGSHGLLVGLDLVCLVAIVVVAVRTVGGGAPTPSTGGDEPIANASTG